MATTDANGIVFYETTDPVSPLQTLLNSGQQSISNALSATVRVWPVADATARTAILALKGSSAANPLFVWQADVKATLVHDGTSWTGLLGDTIAATTNTTQGPAAAGVDLALVGSFVDLTTGRWEITGAGSMKATGGISDTCTLGIYNVTASALVSGSRGTSNLIGLTGSNPIQTYPIIVNVTTTTRYCVQMHPNGGSAIKFEADAGGLSSWIRARRV